MEIRTHTVHCRNCGQAMPPTLGRAWLHTPTGSTGVRIFAAHHDGGPIVHANLPLLDALTPSPLPDGFPPDAGRTETEVADALTARGWRTITRGQMADALRLEGYELGIDRGRGHVLYADEADTQVWNSRFPYTRDVFVVRAANAPRPEGWSATAPATPPRLGVVTITRPPSAVFLHTVSRSPDGKAILHTGGRLADPFDTEANFPDSKRTFRETDSALTAQGWVPITCDEAAQILADSGLSGALDVLSGNPKDYLHLHPQDETRLRMFVLYHGVHAPADAPTSPRVGDFDG